MSREDKETIEGLLKFLALLKRRKESDD